MCCAMSRTTITASAAMTMTDTIGTTIDGRRRQNGNGAGLGSPDPHRPLGADGGLCDSLPDGRRAANAPYLCGLRPSHDGDDAHRLGLCRIPTGTLWGFRDRAAARAHVSGRPDYRQRGASHWS